MVYLLYLVIFCLGILFDFSLHIKKYYYSLSFAILTIPCFYLIYEIINPDCQYFYQVQSDTFCDYRIYIDKKDAIVRQVYLQEFIVEENNARFFHKLTVNPVTYVDYKGHK